MAVRGEDPGQEPPDPARVNVLIPMAVVLVVVVVVEVVVVVVVVATVEIVAP